MGNRAFEIKQGIKFKNLSEASLRNLRLYKSGMPVLVPISQLHSSITQGP